MQVTLIAATAVDWKSYIQSVLIATDKSPTRGLDARSTPIHPLAAYIASLDSIANNDSDPIEALKQAVSLLEHISLSFSIETNDLSILAVHSGIAATVGKGIIICTATLGTWKQAIIEACKPSCSKVIRTVFNEILFILRETDLAYLFSDFNIKDKQDGTFLLELIR